LLNAPEGREAEFGKGNPMAGKTDKAKGRIKEAAGALTKNKSLKREGKIDQIVGGVKEAVETVVDTVKEKLAGTGAKKLARRAR
jgi:uncharacterized protein YjbJ (UPF0337 family)